MTDDDTRLNAIKSFAKGVINELNNSVYPQVIHLKNKNDVTEVLSLISKEIDIKTKKVNGAGWNGLAISRKGK